MDTLLSSNDCEALQLAIDLTLAEPDQVYVESVNLMLAEDTWEDAGCFCAYHRQHDALNLLPWQEPPCWTDEDNINLPTPQCMLTKKMLSLGISKYHPDPVAAIQAAMNQSKQ